MNKISFLDLKQVNGIIENEIHGAIERVLYSGWYILGDECQGFEKKLVYDLVGKNNEGYVIGCNSGTDALSLALRSGGVKSGDEVITVSHTAIPTISAIVSVGALPVFVDICKDTWVMDTQQIANVITEHTKAIICVHLYGNMVDVFEVKKILKHLKREDIMIIEDVAQAHGAYLNNQQAGTIGDFGAFSFYPSKNIGALGDGGAVFTKNEEYYQKLLMYRNYGQKDRYNALVEGGINSRLDEIQAAILSVKLNYLHEWNREKFKLMQIYKSELAGENIFFQLPTKNCIPAWHLCVIALENKISRDSVMTDLLKNGIQTLIHYPYPTHLQKAFQKFKKHKLENTEELAQRIISLPFSYIMKENQIEYIAKTVKKVVEGVK